MKRLFPTLEERMQAIRETLLPVELANLNKIHSDLCHLTPQLIDKPKKSYAVRKAIKEMKDAIIMVGLVLDYDYEEMINLVNHWNYDDIRNQRDIRIFMRSL